eukprot:scaffold126364_cov28-Tisochrysis_lutea.AAC.6
MVNVEAARRERRRGKLVDEGARRRKSGGNPRSTTAPATARMLRKPLQCGGWRCWRWSTRFLVLRTRALLRGPGWMRGRGN